MTLTFWFIAAAMTIVDCTRPDASVTCLRGAGPRLEGDAGP